MKKTLLFSFLCLLSFAASAQNHANFLRYGLNPPKTRIDQNMLSLQPQPASDFSSNDKGNSTQGFGLFQTLNTYNPALMYYGSSSMPIAYEPLTKLYYFLYADPTQGTGTDFGANLKIFYTAANFKSWGSSPKVLAASTSIYYAEPQLAVMNPGGSKQIDSLNFLGLTQKFENAGGGNYQRTDKTWFLRYSPSPGDEYPISGPANASAKYNWGSGGLVNFNSTSVFGAVLGSQLQPKNTATDQYGAYGAAVFEATAQDLQATIPPSWALAQFKDPGNIGSTYNGPMYTDADANGVCYTALNDIFSDNDQVRTVAFSTSKDLGKTWSDFTRMPSSTLDAYAQFRQQTTALAADVYAQDALMVTGENHFSYFMRVVLYDAQQAFQGLDLAEVEYTNGTWSMRPVASLNDVVSLFVSNDSVNSANSYDSLVAYSFTNPRGNEVEVARTADGKTLVVKWIDYNTNLGPIVISPSQTVLVEDQQTHAYNPRTLDTTYATDVYVSSRDLTSSSWSNAKNLTADKVFDKCTHMPRVVADLKSIPMISLRAVDKSKWATSTAPDGPLNAKLPAEYAARIYNKWSTINYGLFDGTVPVQEDPAPVAVSSLQMSAAMPNPTSDIAGFSYSTLTGGHVVATLTNTLGQNIATIYNDTVEPGAHAFNYSTSQLIDGTYFVTISVNGQTQTKSLVVSH